MHANALPIGDDSLWRKKGGRLKNKSTETSKKTKGQFLLQEGWEFGSHRKRKNSTGTRNSYRKKLNLKKNGGREERFFSKWEEEQERTAPCPALSGEKHDWARKRRPVAVRHGWQRPPDGLYKLNVDAGFSEDSGTGSTGAVLRSDKGVFIVGSCSAISFAEDVSSAEARALRDGLLLASEVGVQKIIVESDCQDVIDTMLLDDNSLGPAAAVYEECSFLAKNFSLIQFSFCPREANMVAHTLARFAEPTRTIKWMEEPPGFLIDTLANDVLWDGEGEGEDTLQDIFRVYLEEGEESEFVRTAANLARKYHHAELGEPETPDPEDPAVEPEAHSMESLEGKEANDGVKEAGPSSSRKRKRWDDDSGGSGVSSDPVEIIYKGTHKPVPQM
ncbi:hypothetical protein D1007_51201 [Hordeum vulgare]|nr:hypothetical protein D1007_51201 [Hordeum vulgare]